MTDSPKLRIVFPYLLLLASVLMPVSGLANSVDVFYFGILKSEAFTFVVEFIAASTYTFFVAFRQIHLLTKILLILLGLLLLSTVLYLMKDLVSHSEFAVRPIVDATSYADFKNRGVGILFPSEGYFFGSLVGLSTGNWIKFLRSTNLSIAVSTIIPLIVGVMISAAGINMLFLGSFTFTLILTLAGILTLICVSVAAKKALKRDHRSLL